MRIAFALGSAEVGGSETNALRTAKALLQLGHEVHCICLAPGGRVLDEFRDAGIPILHLPLGSFRNARALSTGRKLFTWLRHHRIDVVHAYDPYSDTFAVPVARAASTPLVVASQRWWRDPPGRLLRLGTNASYRIAHCVIVNSERVRRRLIAQGHSSDRVHTVSNLVEPHLFDVPTDQELEVQRSHVGLVPGLPVIGIVARLTQVKDHATFLRAAALLIAEGVNAQFVVIGDGELRNELEGLVDSLGIRDVVHFTGMVRTSSNISSLLDVAALTSLAEGFPNAVVEAMAAGRPVVATDVGGTPDALLHGHTGYLVPPSNPRELADRFRELLEDPALVARMGQRAREVALSQYSAPIVIEQLLAIYRSNIRQHAFITR